LSEFSDLGKIACRLIAEYVTNMSTIHEIDEAGHRPEEQATYRAWYAGFDAAKGNERLVEEPATFREWYAHFDAGKWDRQFEADVASGRLDWLVAEGRKDRQEGRCTDR
jgi:hypothetical protein